MNHRELEVWRLGRELCSSLYRTTREFPEDERFGLTSQIRRASVSVVANIAEGAGRANDGDLARFVRISLGSLSEIDTLLQLSRDLEYLGPVEADELETRVRNLGVKLRNFLVAVERRRGVREESRSYDENSTSDDLELPNDRIPTALQP